METAVEVAAAADGAHDCGHRDHPCAEMRLLVEPQQPPQLVELQERATGTSVAITETGVAAARIESGGSVGDRLERFRDAGEPTLGSCRTCLVPA